MQKMLCVFALLFALQTNAQTNTSKLSVTGVGTVTHFPNAAELTIYLRHIKPTLREAVNENQKTEADVLKIVKQYVTDTTAIKVSLITTDKATEWNSRLDKYIFLGYESSQRIVFTILELSKMQELTEKLLQTKFNKIEEVNYFHTNGAQYIKEAQEKAVADAIETTKRLAKAANVNLGAINYISNGESPANAKNYTSRSYNFETYNKSMGGRGVSSSGQLIIYASEVLMETEMLK